MTLFLTVETLKHVSVAWLQDDNGKVFVCNKRSLQLRIEDSKKNGLDTSIEEKALETLNEVTVG